MLAREVVLHREDVRLDHEGEPHDDARQDAADQQRADRDADGRAVDHHQDRRRDHDAHGRGAGGEADREALVVAALDHRRVEDAAERRGVGRAAAGDARQEHADDDVHMREPAAQVADHRHGELDEPLGDAADRHHAAGEEEERQRQQREAVDAVEHLLHRDGQRQALLVDHQDRGDRERERDRDADHERDRRGRRTAAASGSIRDSGR